MYCMTHGGLYLLQTCGESRVRPIAMLLALVLAILKMYMLRAT